ncbi:MAG TPA: GLPGLI family protein [Chitinophagaceae bacterium]|jgi:GLPGLI family protein|nr:GLPGLI family protein [Chitinophagaceae bacterium]
MKKIFFFLLMLTGYFANAQQYINSGMIEFEVRTNNHKTFGDGIFAEMFKDKIPQFTTSWYTYTFKDDKAVYKYDRIDERTKLPWGTNNAEDNFWFSDYTTNTFANQKFVFDNTYLLTDSLMKIDWRLMPNETREIAGFNCRKAQGIIFDSVYVFAFYTDEITISGGPMGLHGLPGMILGVTIPRMYTSWIATKLQIDNVKYNSIVAPTKGKKKPARELQTTVAEATKDWGTWGQQSIWNIFL